MLRLPSPYVHFEPSIEARFGSDNLVRSLYGAD
jgi:hypothetical protein